MKNSQKGFIVPLLIAIIAVLVIGGGIYIYSKKSQVPQAQNTGVPIQTASQQTPQSSTTAVIPASPDSTSNWSVYNDTEFSIKYPAGWTASKLTTQENGVIFIAPTSGPNNVSDFGAECAPTANNDPGAVVATYTKILGNKLQNTNVIVDGVNAVRLDINDPSGPTHASRILFSKNGNTCDISEAGLDYYQSPLFDSFYNSFKFVQ